jgi:hypothetical protein
MPYVFRTSGPWGPGLSEDLSPQQVDGNFWQAIQDIQAKAVAGVGISNIVVTGNSFTVVLTDHTLLGPYPLPIAQLIFRGEWAPNTAYQANDIFTHGGSTYIVLQNHTSHATFDPFATDGLGNNLYGLLLQNPALTIPAGGAAGTFLRKATGADYVTHWTTTALGDLSNVLVTTPANGQVLTYQSGVWVNLSIPTAALAGLSDVGMVGGLANGQVLTFNSATSKWTNQTPAVPPLHTLPDVSVLFPQAGQPLVYNGTAWVDASTVDMPCGGLNTTFGAITIDRSQGEVHRFLLTGTVTSVLIIGWPPGGQFARLVLEIQNSGGYGWAWPTILWPGGTVPSITSSGKDVFILISFDGGTTIYGNVVGQAFA